MWYLALVLSVLCLWPATSFGALAVDAATSSACYGCSSLSWSHTVSGADRCLLVAPTRYDTADALATPTYNGVSMTLVPSSGLTSGNREVALYSLIAPATGANNVQVTSTPGVATELTGGAVSFTDCHQTTPTGTAVTGSGTSATPSVNVSSAATEIVLDNLSIFHDGTLTVGAGQTQRWNAIGVGGFAKYAGSTETGAGTTTMSWSNSTSQAWAISAVAVKPTGAASSSAVPSLTLLGVGP